MTEACYKAFNVKPGARCNPDKQVPEIFLCYEDHRHFECPTFSLFQLSEFRTPIYQVFIKEYLFGVPAEAPHLLHDDPKTVPEKSAQWMQKVSTSPADLTTA